MRRALAPVAALAILLAGCSSAPKGGVLFGRVSGSMPRIEGATLTGGRLGPADYRGEVVVVNFWNYDCPPCAKEQPILEKDSEHLRELGVQTIGVMYTGGNWPNDVTDARAYVQRFGVTYPTIVDRSSTLARAFHIPGIPATVIVDRTGQMRYQVLGAVVPGELELLVAKLAI